MTHPGERALPSAEAPKTGVVYGVVLHDYGKEHSFRRPIRGTPIERQEVRVMVDARHVREDHQLKPVSEVYVDTQHPGAVPVGETSYGYVERPDGTVALQYVHQIARTGRGLQSQRLNRDFDAAGGVVREELEVDRVRRGERIYIPPESCDGEMVHDNILDDHGRVCERTTYQRRGGEREWRVVATRYTYDAGGQYREEVAWRATRLQNPPPLTGKMFQEFMPAPSLPYEEPIPTFSFEKSIR